MKHSDTGSLTEILKVKKNNLTLFIDIFANIHYQVDNNDILPLSKMPWKFQLPFFLTFLHDYQLSERFKNMQVIGAIDLYVKWKFCNGEELTLDK